MVLVDTSIWIQHFRQSDSELMKLANEGWLVTHDFVIGELACGQLPKRSETIRDLNRLPKVPVVSHSELLHFIDRNELAGSGLSFVDMHLLASVRATAGLQLWTADKRLQQRLG